MKAGHALAALSRVSLDVRKDALMAAAIAVLDTVLAALRGSKPRAARVATKKRPVRHARANRRRRRADKSLVADSSPGSRANRGSTGASKAGRAEDRLLAVGTAPTIPTPAPTPSPVEAAPAKTRRDAAGGGHAQASQPEVIEANGVTVTVKFLAGAVAFGEASIDVRRPEARLVACLARAMPHPVAREFIAGKVWTGERPPPTYDTTLSAMVSRLTAPLAGIGLTIKTVRGIGIALQKAGE